MVEPDRQDPLAEDLERHTRLDPDELDLGDEPRGPVLGPVLERIGEDALDAVLGLLLAEDRDGPADPLGEEPGVVEAEQVVGVMVREGDRVDPADPLAEELDPHLGRGVDQQVPGRERQQHARPGALVPRVARGADGAIAAQHRDARGGPGSQEDQPPRRSCRALDQVLGSPGTR